MNFLVGGVNSPVRTFWNVGLKKVPIFTSAKGCYLYDNKGNKFIDLISGWGSQICGYNTPIYQQIFDEFKRNHKYFVGLTNPYENELAGLICKAIPSIEKVRFTNSGTEAVATAIRLARAITGNDIIIKFAGCYHGHIDYLLFKAGSGAMTHSISTSDGIPQLLSKTVIVAPFNNPKVLKSLYKKVKNKLAGVILEGVPANMGLIVPQNHFLEEVFEFTHSCGGLFILDEIVTAFRVCYGGLQTLLNIKPDITTLGKIIGGGFPIGAIGGQAKIISNLSPEGKVYQAGTFSGNPLSTFSGVKILNYLKKNPTIYQTLENSANQIISSLKQHFQRKGYKYTINQFKSLFSIFFGVEQVNSYSDVQKVDRDSFKKFFLKMYKKKILLPPSPFETIFLNASISQKEINYIKSVLEDTT